MTCRLHQTNPASRTTSAVHSWNPNWHRVQRSIEIVHIRVRALTTHSHFQHRVDPSNLESVLSARAAMNTPGILRACTTYWVDSQVTCGTPLDVFASVSTDSVGVVGARLMGTVYRKPFDAVFRVISTANKRTARRTIDDLSVNATKIESIESVQCKVRAHCARILGVDAIIGSEALSNLGMDSLAAAEVRSALQSDFGLLLPIHAAFECPTPDSLAEYVFRESKKNRVILEASRDNESTQPPVLVFLFALVALLVSSVFYIARSRS